MALPMGLSQGSGVEMETADARAALSLSACFIMAGMEKPAGMTDEGSRAMYLLSPGASTISPSETGSSLMRESAAGMSSESCARCLLPYSTLTVSPVTVKMLPLQYSGLRSKHVGSSTPRSPSRKNFLSATPPKRTGTVTAEAVVLVRRQRAMSVLRITCASTSMPPWE